MTLLHCRPRKSAGAPTQKPQSSEQSNRLLKKRGGRTATPSSCHPKGKLGRSRTGLRATALPKVPRTNPRLSDSDRRGWCLTPFMVGSCTFQKFTWAYSLVQEPWRLPCPNLLSRPAHVRPGQKVGPELFVSPFPATCRARFRKVGVWCGACSLRPDWSGLARRGRAGPTQTEGAPGGQGPT